MYAVLTPTELISRLPPSHGTAHQIYLILGARIPKQTAYILRSQESEEMRR